MSTAPAKSSLTALPIEVDRVSIQHLHGGKSLPVVAQPTGQTVDLAAWSEKNIEFIESALLIAGAVLFRGFGPASVDSFRRFTGALFATRFPYEFAMLPRPEVSDLIYQSTLTPGDIHLNIHSECCAQRNWPMRIAFCCMTPAERGGETPLADCRKVCDRLTPEVRDKFARLGVMYCREVCKTELSGVFGTSSPSCIAAYCERNDYEFEWDRQGGIHIRFVAQAIIEHPTTAERVWFNHARSYLGSSYPYINSPRPAPGPVPGLAREKCEIYAYYGDGSPIGDRDMYEIHNAYIAEAVEFPWRKGDILLLDNMLTAHGRNSFAGEREVLLAMGDPYQRLPAGG